jgi:hypothetical protein
MLLLPLATRVLREFTQSLGRGVLSTFAANFAKKWGHFGGVLPAVASEGDLVFRGKLSRPLTLLIRWNLHSYGQLGCWVCK